MRVTEAIVNKEVIVTVVTEEGRKAEMSRSREERQDCTVHESFEIWIILAAAQLNNELQVNEMHLIAEEKHQGVTDFRCIEVRSQMSEGRKSSLRSEMK